MSDTFLNNQEVTAEDLNNIAIDLGYADYSHFPEDPPQSAVSALNQITADLTSAGILQIGNKCAVSITDNTIVVQDGVCVFENGAKKRIEEPLIIPFIENSGTNYLYLFNNVAGNKIELVNSLTEPITGDFVMLALITEKKVVCDKRLLSVAKIGALGSNLVTDFSVCIPQCYGNAGDALFSLEVPTRYSRIFFDYYTVDDGTEKRYNRAIFRLSDMALEIQYEEGAKATRWGEEQNRWPFRGIYLRAERAGDFVNFISRDDYSLYFDTTIYGKFI